MKKTILNLGNALSRAEQKKIKGGEGTVISWDDPACDYFIPDSNGRCYAYSLGSIPPGSGIVWEPGLGGTGGGMYSYDCDC